MQKKLMTLAVAGALAAPMAVQAQSTVQIYGNAEWEYGYIDQGRGRPKADYNEVTGSYVGIKGQENLGGGLTAWFQCETTMDIRSFDQTGLCSRNSGLGFKGAFGNVWGGRWHTPFSRMFAAGIVGHQETGILGFARVYGAVGSTSLASTDPSSGTANRAMFRRRESCLTTYETPNMSGFQLGAAFSCGNAAADGQAGRNATSTAGAVAPIAAPLNGTSNQKPRLWSFAGTYAQGPLMLGLGYERHVNVGVFGGAGPDLTDRAWGASGRYTYGPVKVGAMYFDRKWETGPGAHVKNRTWTLGAEWTIAGPHQLHIAYGDTGDAKGNSLVGVAPTAFGAPAPGPDTGYSAFTIAYQYSFSKRTTAKLGYIRYDNDTNSAAVRVYNSAPLVAGGAANANGQNVDAWALVVKHRF